MKKLYSILLLCSVSLLASANEADSTKIAKYHRSSLFTVMIQHPETQFGKEIHDVFLNMPTPDKFDNHDLHPSLKSFISSNTGKSTKKQAEQNNLPDVEKYMQDNAIARELVAKWFNREPEQGTFDMQLVSDRGNYAATLSEVSLAELSARGKAQLADAGEELIGNTFVLVSDITYINKEEQTKKAGQWMRLAGALAPAYGDVINTAASVTEKFGGFSVKITTYLYRLDWTQTAAETFYQFYWNDKSAPNAERKAAFESDDKTFAMKYIGLFSTTAGNVAVKGFTQKTDEQMIRMVCTRALDRSIVELQREHDEFKVNTPIHSVDEDGQIYVQIGLKEGINEKSQFEVLERIETPEGLTEYKKVGTIAPVKGQIWDNRFMAAEEAEKLASAGAKNPDSESQGGNVNLTATQFKKVSGGELYPGLLVREKTIKSSK